MTATGMPLSPPMPPLDWHRGVFDAELEQRAPKIDPTADDPTPRYQTPAWGCAPPGWFHRQRQQPFKLSDFRENDEPIAGISRTREMRVTRGVSDYYLYDPGLN